MQRSAKEVRHGQCGRQSTRRKRILKPTLFRDGSDVIGVVGHCVSLCVSTFPPSEDGLIYQFLGYPILTFGGKMGHLRPWMADVGQPAALPDALLLFLGQS